MNNNTFLFLISLPDLFSEYPTRVPLGDGAELLLTIEHGVRKKGDYRPIGGVLGTDFKQINSIDSMFVMLCGRPSGTRLHRITATAEQPREAQL